MHNRSIRFAAALLVVIVLLPACSVAPLLKKESTGGWIDWDGRGGWLGSGDAGGVLREEAGSGGAVFAGEPALGAGPAVGTADGAMPAGQQTPNLRAGSVDDNANWDDYLLYLLQAQGWGLGVHEVDVRGRHRFFVENAQGQPVLGARLEVREEDGELLTQAQTGADGVAYFFAAETEGQRSSFEARVSKGSAQSILQISSEERDHRIRLDASARPQPILLDILFLVDSTGSMGDEIDQLKENMISVAERISGLPGSPDLRFGLTTYRDRGDLFTSRTFDFTPDVEAFTQALRQVEADAGGDYPESLNEGLHDALHLPEWRVEDTVSLLFLVADAPPHLDYPQDYDYAQEMVVASAHGIKIFTLASSGLDDQGEYIFRQLAQYSGGKFIFLTYGAEGAPGDETSHHVNDYSVLSLDDLIVRLVQEQLAFLQPE